MSDQMFLLTLIFVFAVIALIALGARSFTQLVALILSNGSKLEALTQEVLQVQMHLLAGKEPSTSSHLPAGSPTMRDDNPSGNSTESTPATK